MADNKPEYFPNISERKLLPIFKPKIKIKTLKINVKTVVSEILIPDMLAPIPSAKLFILKANAKETASLSSILPEPSISAVLFLVNISS